MGTRNRKPAREVTDRLLGCNERPVARRGSARRLVLAKRTRLRPQLHLHDAQPLLRHRQLAHHPVVERPLIRQLARQDRALLLPRL